jgi:hypothetical protein
VVDSGKSGLKSDFNATMQQMWQVIPIPNLFFHYTKREIIWCQPKGGVPCCGKWLWIWRSSVILLDDEHALYDQRCVLQADQRVSCFRYNNSIITGILIVYSGKPASKSTPYVCNSSLIVEKKYSLSTMQLNIFAVSGWEDSV